MKGMLKVLSCGLVLVAVLSLNALAGEDEALTKVAGKVKVTKDGDKVTKIEIVAQTMDENGNDVAKAYVVAEGGKSADVAKLDGKQVEAKGKVEEKDGVATITVKEVKEVKADEMTE